MFNKEKKPGDFLRKLAKRDLLRHRDAEEMIKKDNEVGGRTKVGLYVDKDGIKHIISEENKEE